MLPTNIFLIGMYTNEQIKTKYSVFKVLLSNSSGTNLKECTNTNKQSKTEKTTSRKAQPTLTVESDAYLST